MLPSPVFVLAHGAGAGKDSEWMTRWASYLGRLGDVFPFNYSYMDKPKRSAPPRAEKLVGEHIDAILAAQAKFGKDRPVVLAGKSMGSRVGCHVAAITDEEKTSFPKWKDALPSVKLVVCFGYPLIGVSGKLRDEVLRRLPVPGLFVQGSKDKMSSQPMFEEILAAQTTTTPSSGSARPGLFIVEGGDHSLKVGARTLKAQGKTQDEVDLAVLDAIRTAVETCHRSGTDRSGSRRETDVPGPLKAAGGVQKPKARRSGRAASGRAAPRRRKAPTAQDTKRTRPATDMEMQAGKGERTEPLRTRQRISAQRPSSTLRPAER